LAKSTAGEGTPSTGPSTAEPGRVLRFVPLLTWLPSYDRTLLRADLLAGLSVAAIIIPSTMAYGQQAGLPPVAGLYASLIPLLLYAVFGTSRQLVVGPDAGGAAIVAAALTPLAAPGTDQYLGLAAMMAVFTAVVLILGRVARLGFMADFLSKPVLVGYLNGVALNIIAGQIGKVFGISIEADGFFGRLAEFIRKADQTHELTLLIGALVLGFVLLMRRINRRVPAALLGTVGALAIVKIFDLQAHGVATVGAIPAGLPIPKAPSATFGELGPLLGGALGFALVAYVDSTLTARRFAAKNGYSVDPNQEFLGLGAANLATSFFQGYPIGSSASRTTVNDQSGGTSQVAGIAAAVGIAIVLLFLTEPLAYLPNAALGAVVIAAGLSLLDVRTAQEIHRVDRLESFVAMFTTLGVLIFGILVGLLLAVGLTILNVVRRVARPDDAVLVLPDDIEGTVSSDLRPDVATIPGMVLYRFDAPLFFANAGYLMERVRRLVGEHPESIDWFVLDAEGVNTIDLTAAEAVRDLREELEAQNVVLVVARAKGQISLMFDRMGLTDSIGREHFFPSVRAAVNAYNAHRAAEGKQSSPESRR
jgi:high affinity sulfate transporter 1